MRSASAAILDVSCRAAKFDASPPSSVRTCAALGWMECPITARVPALDTVNLGTRSRSAEAWASRSAVGDRQMFPVQMNKRCRADSLLFNTSASELTRASNMALTVVVRLVCSELTYQRGGHSGSRQYLCEQTRQGRAIRVLGRPCSLSCG